MSKLATIFKDHEGCLADQWESYLGTDESELPPFIEAGKPVSLPEVGGQGGGSRQIWRMCLPPGLRVVGININRDCAKLGFDGNTALAGAATPDRALRNLILDIVGGGLHRCGQGTGTDTVPHKRMRGGKSIVENLHTSHRSEAGGSFHAPGSSLQSPKRLAGGLNYDHIRGASDAPRAEIGHLRDVGRSVA